MMRGEYVNPVASTVARRWRSWLVISVGFLVLYELGLVLAMVARFGEWPNYYTVYDLFESCALVLERTPALQDTIPILLSQPVFEAGYKNPRYYNIAEWSFMLMPAKMLLVFVVGGLLATFAVLRVEARRRACDAKPLSGAAASAAFGAGLVGLTSASLSWVVCCATPSWVVSLAMLGVSTPIALALRPAGTLITATGILLVLGAVICQSRFLSARLPSRSDLETYASQPQRRSCKRLKMFQSHVGNHAEVNHIG